MHTENNAYRLRVITGPDTRWAYVNAWEPKRNMSGKLRFSVRLLIPKSDAATVNKIRRAIDGAYWVDLPKIQGKSEWPPRFDEIQNPLRDGDACFPDRPEYQGNYFINASSHEAPGIVDANLNLVITRSDVYSGVYGRASISFYGFNAGDARGVLCALNNLQLIRPGEPLGHKPTPEEDFAEEDN